MCGTTVAKTLTPGFALNGTFQVKDFPVTFRYSASDDGGLFKYPTEAIKEKAILTGYNLQNTIPAFHQMVSIGVSQIDGRHRSTRNDEPIGGGWFEFTTYDYVNYSVIGLTAAYSAKKILLPTIAIGLSVGGTLSKEMSYYSASLSLNIGYFQTR